MDELDIRVDESISGWADPVMTGLMKRSMKVRLGESTPEELVASARRIAVEFARSFHADQVFLVIHQMEATEVATNHQGDQWVTAVEADVAMKAYVRVAS